MSFGSNPYAMGGWGSTPPPSQSSTYSFVRFRIAHPSAAMIGGATAPLDFMNCIVMDPFHRVHLSVSTSASDTDAPGTATPATLILGSQGAVVGNIQWTTPRPTVELHNTAEIPSQRASKFLKATSSSEYRLCLADRRYVWVIGPFDQKMYSPDDGSGAVELLVAAVREHTGEVTLSLSPAAYQQGLLDASVLALALLSSGRL